MILSDKGILKLVEQSSNLISPFSPSKLNGASYDLTLSSEIHEVVAAPNVVHLSNQGDIDATYVSHDISGGYIIKPGQYVLCGLEETIALPDDVVARIMPRTRFTRIGLVISNQFCNPSYAGRLQLGLTNVSPNNISIAKGLSIAQIVFERLDETPSQERLYRNQQGTAYHNESSFIGGRFDKSELSPEVREVFDSMLNSLL